MSRVPIVPIIGGGPAGMSCALWLHNYEMRPVIVEQETALGGMARRSPYPNEWLLGEPDQSARENAARFAGHVGKLGVETWLGCRPRGLRRESGGSFRLDIALPGEATARPLSAAALVIATGTQFRGDDWLDQVKNARQLAAAGRVHLGPTAFGEPGADLGTHVAVIGGGDNAFDVSRMLAENGVRVSLVMRSKSPKAQPLLVERLRPHQASGMVEVLGERTVEAVEEVGSGIRVRLDNGGEIAVDHVALLFGYLPNSSEPWLADLALKKDPRGYVEVDGNMETSCRGVFAVGDVANPGHPCIATAIGSGTMAARRIQMLLAPGNAPSSSP
jgi:thioredoxin reductase (NADPH)